MHFARLAFALTSIRADFLDILLGAFGLPVMEYPALFVAAGCAPPELGVNKTLCQGQAAGVLFDKPFRDETIGQIVHAKRSGKGPKSDRSKTRFAKLWMRMRTIIDRKPRHLVVSLPLVSGADAGLAGIVFGAAPFVIGLVINGEMAAFAGVHATTSLTLRR